MIDAASVAVRAAAGIGAASLVSPELQPLAAIGLSGTDDCAVLHDLVLVGLGLIVRGGIPFRDKIDSAIKSKESGAE